MDWATVPSLEVIRNSSVRTLTSPQRGFWGGACSSTGERNPVTLKSTVKLGGASVVFEALCRFRQGGVILYRCMNLTPRTLRFGEVRTSISSDRELSMRAEAIRNAAVRAGTDAPRNVRKAFLVPLIQSRNP